MPNSNKKLKKKSYFIAFSKTDSPVAAIMSAVWMLVATQNKQIMEVQLWEQRMSDGKASFFALCLQLCLGSRCLALISDSMDKMTQPKFLSQIFNIPHCHCARCPESTTSVLRAACWMTGSFSSLLPREPQWTYMNNLAKLRAGLYPPAVPPALGKVRGEANAAEIYLSSGANKAVDTKVN